MVEEEGPEPPFAAVSLIAMLVRESVFTQTERDESDSFSMQKVTKGWTFRMTEWPPHARLLKSRGSLADTKRLKKDSSKRA